MTWTRATDVPRLPTVDLVVPTLEFFHGRDGLPLTGWLYRPRGQAAAFSGATQMRTKVPW